MRRKTACGLLVAGLALTGVFAAAGQPRTSSQTDTSQMTVIRGRVVSADGDPRPLRGARLFVTGSSDEPVLTDGEGRFVARVTVPYTLRITKAGFAPAVVNGAVSGSADLEIALSPGAVLTGVVVDELGFPVTDARVRVQWAGTPGAAPGVTDFFAETDDAGEYRVGSLASGRYTINSEPALPSFPDTVFLGVYGGIEIRMREMRLRAERPGQALSELVRIELRAGEELPVVLAHRRRAVIPPDAPIGGAVDGVVLDAFGEPVEGVAVRLWRVRFAGDRSVAEPTPFERRTDDRGQYRLFHVRPGKYLLAATAESADAPVYFPGTTVVANAVPLTIGRKEQATGVNVAFTRTREARVAGVALDPRGTPLQGTVTLVASRRSGGTALPERMAKTDDAGAFEFRNVPAGEYVLRATARQAFGAQFVTVAGPDVPPVTIAATPVATLGGRVVFDDRPGVSPADFFVTALPDPDSGPLGRLDEGRVANDGTFEMRGLAGTLRLSARLPPGWWVKSIDVGGVDAIDQPLRFAGPDDSRNDATIVVSPGAATFSGRVTDDTGRPVDDYRVVVSRGTRSDGSADRPYVRIAAGPETDGGFTIRSLPPGDYWVVALDAIDGDGESGEWQNPDVLGSLIAVASRVSLEEGQRATTQLRLTHWRR